MTEAEQKAIRTIEECARDLRKQAGGDSLKDRIAFFLDWYYPACETGDQGAEELAAFLERGDDIPQSYKLTGRVL